ncbi:aldehyde-lyase domain-containing protein [Tanacetum coccineum]
MRKLYMSYSCCRISDALAYLRSLTTANMHVIGRISDPEPMWIPSNEIQGAALSVVKSEEGVKKIEEAASVDGVDCVQMGPLDLSASMGYLWVPRNKKVKEMMMTVGKGVLKTIGKGNGKDSGGGVYLGVFAMSFDTQEDMRSRGYLMISGAVDIAMVRNACVEYVKSEANAFNNFISRFGLFDFPLGGRHFTRFEENGGKAIKLDSFLALQVSFIAGRMPRSLYYVVLSRITVPCSLSGLP